MMMLVVAVTNTDTVNGCCRARTMMMLVVDVTNTDTEWML